MNRNPSQLRQAILAENPTKQQQDAVFATELEFLLRASPGSGKTWTSCRRFLWRVENWSNPDGGLALLSFTKAAVREFEKATAATKRGSSLRDPNFVGTFDSFIERFIISPFGHLPSKAQKRPKLFLGPRHGDAKKAAWTVWVSTETGKMPVPAWDIVPFLRQDGLAFKASFGWGEIELPGAAASEAVSAFLKSGFYTHVQRNFWACYILDSLPRLSKVLSRRFPEIIVDEAQDTCVWHVELLGKLRDSGSKITLIGDPDQCIYEFSLASASSIARLKNEWQLPQKPLDKSFRCNDTIARAVRKIGGNPDFAGCGTPRDKCDQVYVFGDDNAGFADAISFFRNKLREAGINESCAAILCRGHEQKASIHGSVRYLKFAGKTRMLAEAAFLRDKNRDMKGALERTEKVLRALEGTEQIWGDFDVDPESKSAVSIRTAIWRFVRSADGLPSISLSATEWLERARTKVEQLLKLMGITNCPNLKLQLRRNGINGNEAHLPLIDSNREPQCIRSETIHGVKGEGIDAVLVVGSKAFFDSVVKDSTEEVDSEDRRLCYVAMTRARHLLVVAIPQKHLAKSRAFWTGCGFDYRDKSALAATP